MIKINIRKQMHAQNGKSEININFNLKENVCTALFGESGAGKTTILRMLAGLTMPDSGIIQTTDRTLYDSEKNIHLEAQKRNIGFVFQDYALFPNMNVEQNILFGLDDKKDAKKNLEYIDKLISIMELGSFLKKYPHEISGGQKQRVALARALVRKPKILLLDEPLSALDQAMRQKLQEYLEKLIEEFSFTTVLVSHDIKEIKFLAKEIIVLKNGLIEFIGAPSVFII